MAFQLDCQQEPGREILRVIREEIAAARRNAGSEEDDLVERIHHARTACKRIRAALRLLRAPCPGLCAGENRWFRDSARQLARFRDTDVMVDCIRELSGPSAPRHRQAPFLAAVHNRLQRRRKMERQDCGGPAHELGRYIRRMGTAGRRLAAVRPKPVSFAALVDGLVATYRRARRAMPRRAAAETGRFHEWRKQAKRCGYQCRLLREIWPRIMKALAREFDELGELLGAAHDLSVLGKFIEEMEGPGIDGRLVAAGVRLVEQRRDERRCAALALGRRLFANKSHHFARRLKSWRRSERILKAKLRTKS